MEWQKWLDNQSVEDALFIIDDALSHGFEFKVEDGNVFFREQV